MKKRNYFCTLLLSILLLATAFIISSCDNNIKLSPSATSEFTPAPTPEIDYSDKHIKITALGSGYDIFTPTEGVDWAYRYGPAILLNEDGSIDAWFASPAAKNSTDEMDWFTYRHSEDGGYTWTDEKVVLYPSPGTLDELSVCDPAVFYYDGYYYIGYTSTIDGTGGGLCNSTFVARSKNPDGPFEKWNGSGWGGDPYPIIYYTGPATSWGEGEPSFVILDDTLYVYITMDTVDASGERIKNTKVYTTDITEENWPANLEFRGYAINRWGINEDGYDLTDADSIDVAYVEKYKKFVAIGTNRRFTDYSCIVYYESNDGLTFNVVSEINTDILCGCHNAGIMKDNNGHIKEGDRMMIGYAYAGYNNGTWGYWATRFTSIEITVTDNIDRNDMFGENLKQKIVTKKAPDEYWPIAITTSPHQFVGNIDKGNITLNVYWYNTDYKSAKIKDISEITFSDYDTDVISINGFKATPLKVGTTWVTATYKGLTQKFLVRILPSGVDKKSWDCKMVDFKPTVKEYNISLSQQEVVQIRSLATLENGKFCELYNSSASPISLKNGKIKFTVADKDICKVGSNGYVTPLSAGETTVTVKCNDFSYDIKVNVTK